MILVPPTGSAWEKGSLREISREHKILPAFHTALSAGLPEIAVSARGPHLNAIMMKAAGEQHIEVEGVVSTVLAGTMFRVTLENKHVVLATICGKMRKRWVRITAGDRVKMEMSPYDLTKARITWRVR